MFQVPRHFFSEAPEDSTVLAIKILPNRFTISQKEAGDASTRAIPFQSEELVPRAVIASSQTLNFSLEHTRAVQAKIANAIGMKQSWALVLLNASEGCVELTFALPSVIMDEMVKPLFNNRASPSGLLNLEEEEIYVLCGPPGKPFPTSITNDSVSLKWEKPEYQGYHSHSHYCIFYRPITDLKWEKLEEVTTVEHVELNGLLSTEKISSYVFKVKAVSKVGAGVESKESNPVQLLNVRLHVIECLFVELLSARQLIRYLASHLVLRLYVCMSRLGMLIMYIRRARAIAFPVGACAASCTYTCSD